MKRYYILANLFIFFSALCSAQSANVMKAGKSVFTLTTFKADGSILSTTHGVYYSEQGDAISPFTPFIGASSALTIDASGKKAEVEAIYGANEMYDICRFKVSAKGNPLPLAQTSAAAKVYAVGYSTKKPTATPLTVNSSEQFKDKYTYFVFNEEINEDIEGCPIVNDNGELIGLVQRSKTTYDIHSTDAKFYSELVASGLSSQDHSLQKTNIRAALPTDYEQARLMLLMFDSTSDSANVVNTINDYNEFFPGDIDGYAALARYHTSRNNLDAASAALEDAVKKAKQKDEAYYEYAKQTYNVAIYNRDSTQTAWTFDKAAELVEKAIDTNPQPIYKHLLGQIKYSQTDYSGALTIFDELSKSDMSNSEVFYEMAQCKSQLGAEGKEILELLNQAVDRCPKPLTSISAPYLFARAVTLESLEENRAALKDYNTYDSLMNYNATPEFYYTRYKCEMKVRQYQQALNDIAHAVILNPGEVTYMAELASLQLRVGKYEDVLRTCELSMNITDQYADIYILKGVALIRLERKSEALEAFQKATDLGDPRGAEYIEKYK